MNPYQIKFEKENFVEEKEGRLTENYEVLKKLGKGGFGTVFEIKNKKTGDIYACKQLSKKDINNLEKFKREIDLLSKMDHPNIIKLCKIYESSRSLYLVMEECKGGELFDRLVKHIEKKEKYSEKEVAKILFQVMSAIKYCHNNGICHRDLKPDNLLYLNEGSEENNPIKLIDFGYSKYYSKEKLKSKVGTVFYASPEVLKGNYSEKCDIWSVGVIMYILLSGKAPFYGEDNNITFNKILEMKYSFPDKQWKNISNEAKDLISHMLTPEKERYSAGEVLEHPWFNILKQKEEKELSINSSFLKDYKNFSCLKKMVLMLIATKLEENEIKNLTEIFSLFDKKHDGQISFNEFEEGLKGLKSEKFSKNEIESIFNSIDTNKNNKIDYTEFLAATLEKKYYIEEERLMEAFSEFDKDNKGKISKEDILKILNLEPEYISIAEEIIKTEDKDGDGFINYQEFLELMINKKQKTVNRKNFFV